VLTRSAFRRFVFRTSGRLGSTSYSSTWPGPAQVAELAVRRALDETDLDALSVTRHEAVTEHAWSTTVVHRDGRRWQVGVLSEPTDIQRAESCDKPLKELRRWTWSVEALPVG